MAFTHLQPAEPTTLGYRLAVYAQDLLIDDATLRFVFENLTTKGLRGAVGTAASYEQLLDHSGRSAQLEAYVLERFGLQAREVSTQTYPRKLDYLLLSALAGSGSVAFEVCRRRAHLEQSGVRRSRRAVRHVAGRQLGDAVQTQPDLVRAHRFAGAVAAWLRDVAWQNAATNFSSARSTIARIAARFCRKRCFARTSS